MPLTLLDFNRTDLSEKGPKPYLKLHIKITYDEATKALHYFREVCKPNQQKDTKTYFFEHDIDPEILEMIYRDLENYHPKGRNTEEASESNMRFFCKTLSDLIMSFCNWNLFKQSFGN